MDNRARILEILKKNSDDNIDAVEETVKNIVNDVKYRGDEALKEYTSKFDKQNISNFKVEIKSYLNNGDYESSYLAKIPEGLKQALVRARYRIRQFHLKDLQTDWSFKGALGEKLGVRYSPVESVGIYVPGGNAPLVSTVLMTAVPAKVAGVKRVVMVSPPPINDAVLAAAELAGVDEVYQIGGAQAIAALAYGTQSIKAVDKIVGPGNIYVSVAKKQVFGKVGIDGFYGPSELAIIADDSGSPENIVWDLMSQLEHGSGLESVLLLTTSSELKEKCQKLFDEKLNELLANNLKTREQIDVIKNSFEKWSAMLVIQTLEEGAELINLYAPEHLEIQVKQYKVDKFLPLIKNAGAIFIGHNSCESLGDYIAGPSHCLPTGSSARFSSGLGCADFVKRSSIIDFSKTDAELGAFKALAEDVEMIARAENLEAHARAVAARKKTQAKPVEDKKEENLSV